MTPTDRIRATALSLPGTDETAIDGLTTFRVADAPFVQIRGDAGLWVRTADSELVLPLTGETDWTIVEDRIARSWELTAPASLLEAGGR